MEEIISVRPDRRTFLKAAAAGASALLAQPFLHAGESPRATKPNIVLILADDLGYGDLGCYGQKMIPTPCLDRMAGEGLRFTSCYAGSTVCAPSRCCLMTGVHTGHARIRGNDRVPLQPEDATVAESLKKAGYSTCLIGKWGLGEPGTTGIPNRKGFDEFFGYLNQKHAHNYFPEHLWHNEEMVELSGNLGMGRKEYSHDLFTDKAIEYLRKPHSNPFFLELAYTIPHANNERGTFEGNGMEVPDLGKFKEKDWPEPEKGKAAMIARMDADIGRILDTLVQQGLDQETIVFFSSDNGPHHESHCDPDFFKSSGLFRGIKRDLYEGGIRVPMLVRWPGKIAPGGVSTHPWAFWDMLPTLCELAGAACPHGIDGQSIVPALFGGDAPVHPFFYWEFHEKGLQQAVRMGSWKAVRKNPDESIELYHLEEDPGESRDISESHPEIIADIENYLKTARVPSEHWH
ncbi:arylsulfatase [bacterium]|nr:arylsulfatase [bacterium]NUP91283.1 arylsulfatase [Candidatus Omnitrophota bacterium]